MRLQSGQVAAMPCWRSQGWMHSEWKLCWQGSVVTLLHSGYPSRHTEHSLTPMLPVLCGPCTATLAQHAYCSRSLTNVSKYAAPAGLSVASSAHVKAIGIAPRAREMAREQAPTSGML
jgi:hypothetical protein